MKSSAKCKKEYFEAGNMTEKIFLEKLQEIL